MLRDPKTGVVTFIFSGWMYRLNKNAMVWQLKAVNIHDVEIRKYGDSEKTTLDAIWSLHDIKVQ